MRLSLDPNLPHCYLSVMRIVELFSLLAIKKINLIRCSYQFL